MPFLYSIAIAIAFVLLLPLLLLHPKTRSGFGQRLGWYRSDFGKELKLREGPRIWLHGASAGDLLALLPIYEELKSRCPKASFIISTMTNSGEAIAQTRFSDAQLFTFVPWDLPWSTRAAMRRIQPDLLVLEYTEIWPNLIRAARGVGARVAVTNGRFSEKNMGRYKLLFSLTGNVLHQIDLLLMREEAEAERVRLLGARPETVRVTGNTKFDALLLSAATNTPEELAWAFGLGAQERVLLAGSTHDGEEALILDVFEKLLREFPELRLIIAPRYIERVPRIAAMVQSKGLEVTCRSGRRFEDSAPGGSAGRGRKASKRQKSVLILDTIGELNSAYRLASLVFVGGSFTTRGGQNILEPAACGKAVLFGPHMQNFRDSVQVLLGRGGIQVNDSEHLLRVARELLGQPEKLEQLGLLARQVVRQIRGASSRNAVLLLELLGQGSELRGSLSRERGSAGEAGVELPESLTLVEGLLDSNSATVLMLGDSEEAAGEEGRAQFEEAGEARDEHFNSLGALKNLPGVNK